MSGFLCHGGCHLSEEPVELHAFGCGIAALDEARPAIHIHQALVVVVVNGGTEEPDVELLSTGIVHILQETPHPAMNCWGWHLDNGPIQVINYAANEASSWVVFV